MSRKHKDDWGVSDTGLSPSDRILKLIEMGPYTEGKDKQGFSRVLGSRFPPQMDRWVSRIKDRQGSPYETRSDVIRDAVFLGLLVISMRLKSDEWEFRADLSRARSDVAARAQMFTEMDDYVQDLKTLYANNDEERAADLLASFIERLSRTEGSDKAKYLAALKSKLIQWNLTGLMERIA